MNSKAWLHEPRDPVTGRKLQINRPSRIIRLAVAGFRRSAKRLILDCSFYDTTKKPNVNLMKGALASFDES